MKTPISLVFVFAVSQAAAQDMAIAEPATYHSGIKEALSDIHDKRGAVEGYLRNEKGLTDFEAFLALESFIDGLAGSDNEQDRDDRFQAIGCLRDYPCESAISYLQTIANDKDARCRRTAAATLARIAIDDPRRLQDLQAAIASNAVSGIVGLEAVYKTISAHLEYGGPNNQKQVQLLRFILDRATQEILLSSMIDEILCREVPKWRASPQRAENAAKMIREHPDDARLVAFFETVRTNALESARAAIPAERSGSVPAETVTNVVSDAGVPATTSGVVSVPDPWADLLDDLPEKKPWVPPPGWEPPF